MNASPPFAGRLEGRAKVSGTLSYEGDVLPSDTLHAALIEAKIACGRVTGFDDSAAYSIPGYQGLITRHDAEDLQQSASTELIRSDRVHFAGQGLAMVIAESSLAAAESARLVATEYEEEPAVTSVHHSAAHAYAPAMCGARAAAAIRRGDVEGGMARAAHLVHERYLTGTNNHHPMEPHVAVCWWEDDDLTVHTCTQAVFGTRAMLAHALRMPLERVRVVSRFLGGGFGCKGQLWFPWLLWTILAARRTKRPVRFEHTRAQLFTLAGRRSATEQDLAIAADAQGRLLAIEHLTVAQTSTHAEHADPVGMVSQWVYRCPNVVTEHRLIATNEPHPIPMRGPGAAPGSFALESAMDELAEDLNIDPVELRLRNIADRDQVTGLPWSSNSLPECLRRGAQVFGWHDRPEHGWREGRLMIGRGVAVSSYPARRQPCALRMRLDGKACLLVECGTQDMGSGTYTTIGQMAADALGLPLAQVDVAIGDTLLPPGPISAGSQVTQSFAPAVTGAAVDLRHAVAELLVEYGGAAFTGLAAEEVLVTSDGLIRRAGTNAVMDLAELFAVAGQDEAVGSFAAPGMPEEAAATGMGFGAVFAEVAIDSEDLMPRVRRIVAAFAAGRIVNPVLARSQYVSGIVGGIGMALHEETMTDPRTGRIVGPSLAEYHVPTHADVPPMQIVMVDEEDDYLSEGIKGVGMLGHVGSSAAIANAIHKATGRRLRRLPIRVEDLL